MAKIDILLAAYDGEKFFAEQIESILSQTFQDFRIIIRDDGSNDRTPKIIAEYAKKYPDKIKIIHDDLICKNFVKNFFVLMKYAEADYVMFSDQDDYWLKYKIQITFDYMKQLESENPGKPALVFTGLQVVDENLKSLDVFAHYDLKKSRYSFSQLLMAGDCVAGCTAMINRAVYEDMGEYSEEIYAHDWWVALYASSCGVLCHVPMALILYRQHNNNIFGADHGQHSRFYKFRKQILKIYEALLHPLRKFQESKTHFYRKSRQAELFRKRYAGKMYPESLKILNDYLDLYGRSRIKRFSALWETHYLATIRHLFDRIFYIIRLLIY